jgi:hypothetical protein
MATGIDIGETNGDGGIDSTTPAYDPTDIGSGGGTTVITGGGGGGGTTVIINPGSAPSSYVYEVAIIDNADGAAYTARNGSLINCHSSVAVFNRVYSYLAARTSSCFFVDCASNISGIGFGSAQNSSVWVTLCSASLSTINYLSNNSSSMIANQCASVFPVNNGVFVAESSTFTPFEFTTATTWWSTTKPYIVTHFAAYNNSFCNNSSTRLAQKITSGLSGPVVDTANISFFWSQIYEGTPGVQGPFPQLGGGTIFNSIGRLGSYRFVPYPHSVDYSNIVTGNGTIDGSASNLSATGLLAIISQGRENYRSVKPPSGVYLPEDGTGKVGPGGLTGAFSVFDLINSL